MGDIEQGDKVTARFTPRRLDTLKQELLPYVGTVTEFEYAWVIDDGHYSGQWALTSRDERFYLWVPEEDLEILSMRKFSADDLTIQ